MKIGNYIFGRRFDGKQLIIQLILDLQRENEELKQTISTLHQNIRNGNIKDIEEMNELKEENKVLQERIEVLEEALYQESKKYCKDSDYAHLQCDLLEEKAKKRISYVKNQKTKQR